MSIETDDSSSNLEEYSNGESHTTDKHRQVENIDKYGESRNTTVSEEIDRDNLNSQKTSKGELQNPYDEELNINQHDILDAKVRLLQTEQAIQISEHSEKKATEVDLNEDQNKGIMSNNYGEKIFLNSGELGTEIVEMGREYSEKEINTSENDVENRRWIIENNQDEEDEILYVCKRYNQITTIVEVHAENDLTDDDSVIDQDNVDDSLIPNDRMYEESCGSEIETKGMTHRDKDVLDVEHNSEETINETHDAEENIKISCENDTNNNIKNSIISTVEKSDLKEDSSMEITRNLNQIKKYTAKADANIEEVYSYEAIEKKIENANKLMVNVKTANVIETNNSNGSMFNLTHKNKAKLMNTRQNTNFKPIQTVRQSRVTNQGDKINAPVTAQKSTKSPRDDAKLINSRGKISPRQEFPKLNKPLPNKKRMSEIKPNLKKSEEKIPDIKTEAGFDMRLLIKAINDLETAKPKSNTCTRSNSGRSSDISKKSTKSSKSNTSTSSKRPNMSFTKEEQKKIDLENQILLKKIMSQKPQQPPQPGSQIRRKPTAYINRQRQQDRISHDNTVNIFSYQVRTVAS